ncbi:hypothetical protein [Oscillibacter sp.]|uniref:hypothetical protein n=1 Tax=Oscillibacter sp. TaxID=1945593 RepID=UPI0028A0869B|nr:hypothetical protein [Oscillibacter sp.]
MDKIICGGFGWERNPQLEDNRLDGGNLFFANAIAQDELSIDTLEADIFSLCKVPKSLFTSDSKRLLTASGKKLFCKSSDPDITSIPYGTPVEYWRDGVLKARLYKSEIVRAGKTVFNLSAVSAVGLLDKLPHMGGLYTGQRMDVVLAGIIGGVFEYTVAPDVAATLIFGWLPSGTKRGNLRQLLFATGAAVRKTADGGINFAFLSVDAPTEIIGDRMYTGGSLTYNTPATGVDVTEHAYYTTAADTEATLFDNTDGSGAVDHKTVTFDKPCHDLTPSSGLTVHESGVNYAIVSGTGTLTGKEYTHQTKIVSRRLEATTENIVPVKDATLVSMANSGSVADRVLAYYSSAKTLSVPIVEDGERPGDAVFLEDAFGDLAKGLLQSMSIIISATLKANTTIITDYAPTHRGNDYNNRVLLTGAGEWTVPEGATRGKCVLVSPGTGGEAGEDGADGVDSVLHYSGSGTKSAGPGAGGKGGERGLGGLGGKILEIEILLTPGTQIPYHAYSGGTAGQDPGEPGEDGQATTFGAYTSDSGERMPGGYIDGMTGDIFGAPGTDGTDGGNGGDGGSSGGDGEKGEDVAGWLGGSGSVGWSGPMTVPVGSASIGGGGGGGAAFGENGTNAPGIETGSVSEIARGGGGADAHPTPEPSEEKYGTGGTGGNGGGGGGGAGQLSATVSGTASFTWTALGGAKGNGTAGRSGAPGCIVVYF